MKYIFQKMTQVQVEEIAFGWHYDGEYSFYDIEADQEDLEEFIDPAKRNDSYFVVMNGDDVIGFFCFNQTDYKTVDIALGMRPDLTGSGNGFEFLRSGIKFAKSKYQATILTLSVATFNKRAIRLYKKVGFEEGKTFIQHTNGSNYEFLEMSYTCFEEGALMKEINSQAIHPSLRKLLSYATSESNIELEYKQYIHNPNRNLFILEKSEEIVGCIGIELISLDCCLIKHIAVSPTTRGNGMGSKMIHFIREKYGLRLISAETDIDAVDFYRNYGFRINSLGEKYPGVERFLCEFESN